VLELRRWLGWPFSYLNQSWYVRIIFSFILTRLTRLKGVFDSQSSWSEPTGRYAKSRGEQTLGLKAGVYDHGYDQGDTSHLFD
jgi:hypothetical protein